MPTPPPPPPEPTLPLGAPSPRAAATRQTVRVRVDRLDRLINLTGELVVGEHVLEAHRRAIEEFATIIERQEEQLSALEAILRRLRFTPSERQRITGHLDIMLDGLNHAQNLVAQQNDQFGDYLNQHHLLLGDLEQEVMSVRLLPISTLFSTIPRAVRDLAATVQKEVELDLRGETTELDRKLLEALHDPLLHLIRNALDHGIETPDERAALGKPRTGKITIQARASGSEIHITIADDGRGIDPDRLRETAVRKRLISAEGAALLNDREALELIFMPGLTTATMITDISGRGVGMDVVRTNISELGGQVQIDSQLGQGTRITLLLPLTLITTRILMVRVGALPFALPASGCRGTTWVYRQHIRPIEGQATIEHEGRTLPLLRLADLLNVEAPPAFSAGERMPALLIGSGQRGVALLIDRLLDEREAVVKPLGAILEQLCRSQPTQMPYSGVVQPGDRSLVLLLNPASLSRAAAGRRLGGMAPPRIINTRRSRLLVADDSFTTRELMRSILQSAGYEVALAIDGSDALDKLRTHPYDLVVSDVEMPRVDGFQLTSRIRQELGLDTLPVVIMTSLASEHHRRRGLEAGAQAYIVKSQFNQDSLLEVIQQLLGEETAISPAG